ncbi:Probable iron export permease protein FetB [Seminavis robusta]|uniref:Probable iron export permease protein FetB n=1 Tax=Seminavis robusta TaxID=568900 RepID=A0A9N8I0N2_9STRA|nr:Probable iron export permease protein FetB [Seminavis robusta]|eukprot:Sro2791_g337200.1 Probable iron export permease protein FetB (729) ;mRNA; f:7465-9763
MALRSKAMPNVFSYYRWRLCSFAALLLVVLPAHRWRASAFSPGPPSRPLTPRSLRELQKGRKEAASLKPLPIRRYPLKTVTLKEDTIPTENAERQLSFFASKKGRQFWRWIASHSRKRRIRLAILTFLLVCLGKGPSAVAAGIATKSSYAVATPPATLGYREVLSASALIAMIGGLGLSRLGLPGLSRQLLIACTRCTLQLQLLGGLFLQWLLPTSQPWLIVAWILTVGTIAAQEAYGRLEYSYPQLRTHLTCSVLLGGISVLSFAMGLRLFGRLQPWYKPQTLIPVAGMLFGNTLSAVTLAASGLTSSFVTNQAQVELLLTRGATYEEAILPLTRESIETALTPTVNALSITGIVHLPGMMTGQILAGQSPRQAAVYQTVIWFLIASVAAATVQLLTSLVLGTLVDKRQHRLQIEDLMDTKQRAKKEKDERAMDKEIMNDNLEDDDDAEVLPTKVSPVSLPNKVDINNTQTKSFQRYSLAPALRIHKLVVHRANVQVSLDLYPGDRLGITGPSGIGKTQILRTIVGLEPLIQTIEESTTNTKEESDDPLIDNRTAPQQHVMCLHGVPVTSFTVPEWRTRVCLVSQDRPAVTGTPREFFENLQQFQYQFQKQNPSFNKFSSAFAIPKIKVGKTPFQIARQEWRLPESAFDRPWSTLSGGEAQRASLAIALALEPDVLIMDESCSAIDIGNTLLVERTLENLQIPIIMVTHDNGQLRRFCTHSMELPSR